MIRRLLTVASAVSLLLCVAVLAAWARSQWTFGRYTYVQPSAGSEDLAQRRVTLLTWRDAAEVMMKSEVYHPAGRTDGARLRLDLPGERRTEVFEHAAWSTSEPGGSPDAADHWGFWYRSPERSRAESIESSHARQIGGRAYSATDERERAAFLPWWFLAVLFGSMPAIGIAVRARRWRRARGGGCPACGYDLRASTGRCPECAATIAARVKA